MSSPPPPPPTPALQWDVFCRVVDNHGDLGVCWRLSVDLARRGQRVRLWVDDASALRWMAPEGEPGVELVAWNAGTPCPAPGDVVIEAFGCDPPADFVAAMAAATSPPAWINLEYLSAEPYVERSHGLPSPQMSGPGRGLVKRFFYPGFTAATGGLIREPGLDADQQAFDRDAWLASHGIAAGAGVRLVSLFCYPGAPVDRLVAALAADGIPTLLATSPGAATDATRAALAALRTRAGARRPLALRQHELPWLTQRDYDRLLWACDLNFVRGEDSWVRAQWAGRPFVWQAYVQDDGAHAAKLEAFLALALAAAPPDAAAHLRRWHEAWNGLDEPGGGPLPGWVPATLAASGEAARAWRARQVALPDLVSTLLGTVAKKR
jgi:uncharacterized repeat protein (TIGR03837 family)